MAGLRGFVHVIALLQNVITSILFGTYMQRVFFGSFFVFSAVDPATINASYITRWVAIPGILYLLSQALSVLLRAPGSVFLVYTTWVASIWPVAEIAVFSVHLAAATPLQSDAWWIWMPLEIIDLILIGISARLLQRSIYGDVERGRPLV